MTNATDDSEYCGNGSRVNDRKRPRISPQKHAPTSSDSYSSWGFTGIMSMFRQNSAPDAKRLKKQSSEGMVVANQVRDNGVEMAPGRDAPPMHTPIKNNGVSNGGDYDSTVTTHGQNNGVGVDS
eukprot:13590159-Ditylum_brightwellii.AAC.2